MSAYRLDIQGLIRVAGGPTEVSRKLAEHGLTISIPGVKKWVNRASMDSRYLVNLLAHEALNGRPIDLTTYILPEKVTRPRSRPQAA